MKKTYTEMDMQFLYFASDDIVTLSAGEFDQNNPDKDKVGDDIFSN